MDASGRDAAVAPATSNEPRATAIASALKRRRSFALFSANLSKSGPAGPWAFVLREGRVTVSAFAVFLAVLAVPALVAHISLVQLAKHVPGAAGIAGDRYWFDREDVDTITTPCPESWAQAFRGVECAVLYLASGLCGNMERYFGEGNLSRTRTTMLLVECMMLALAAAITVPILYGADRRELWFIAGVPLSVCMVLPIPVLIVSKRHLGLRRLARKVLKLLLFSATIQFSACLCVGVLFATLRVQSQVGAVLLSGVAFPMLKMFLRSVYRFCFGGRDREKLIEIIVLYTLDMQIAVGTPTLLLQFVLLEERATFVASAVLSLSAELTHAIVFHRLRASTRIRALAETAGADENFLDDRFVALRVEVDTVGEKLALLMAGAIALVIRPGSRAETLARCGITLAGELVIDALRTAIAVWHDIPVLSIRIPWGWKRLVAVAFCMAYIVLCLCLGMVLPCYVDHK